MRRLLAGLCVAALLAPAARAADPAGDAARAELARERKRLASDSKILADVSRRLEGALNQLAAASRSVSDAAGRSDAGPDEITRREDAVGEAEQEVRSLLERRRLLVDRVVERRRSIAALEADLSIRKPPDSLSGRWAVIGVPIRIRIGWCAWRESNPLPCGPEPER